MPRYPIDRSTNFIVENESWTTIEYDHTSVPGVIYLSLTENKINSIYDDVVNNIADTDELARYELQVPEDSSQVFAPGAKITPVFTLIKNGVPCDMNDVAILVAPDSIKKVKIYEDELQVADNATGIINLIVTLKDYPESQQYLSVYVDDVKQTLSVYIEGKDFIHLDDKEDYTLRITNVNQSVPNTFFLYKDYSLSKDEYDNNKDAYSDDIYTFFAQPHDNTQLLYLKKVKTDVDETNLASFSQSYETEDALAKVQNTDSGCQVITNRRNKLGYVILANAYLVEDKYNFSFKLIEIKPLW